ncbi:MAG: hypothetical protein JNJ56_06475 [Ignavibacteria bacterium]|nr:hypothetical protein [Ignavibacteria bacterium]
MNRSYCKILIFIFILIMTGCSSSVQMSSYIPSEGGDAWRINVFEKSSITKFMPEYICEINDSVVIKESFPVSGGKSFVKKGKYRGKLVEMNGFKISASATDKDGTVFYKNTYSIRILIDHVLIDIFEF